MIVTCPSCEANYRVHNDKVPREGARMRCPRCATEFLAKLPEHERAELPEPPAPKAPAPPNTPPPKTPSAGMGPPKTPPGSFIPPFAMPGSRSAPAAVSGAFPPLTPRPNPFAKPAPPPPPPEPPAPEPPPPAPPPPPAAAPVIPREITGIFSLPDLQPPAAPGPASGEDLGGVLFDSEDDPFAHIEPFADDLDPEPPPPPAPAPLPAAPPPRPAPPPGSLLDENPDLFPATPRPDGAAMRARLQAAMESQNRGGALREEGGLAGRSLPTPAQSDPFAEVVPPAPPPVRAPAPQQPRPVTLAEPSAPPVPSPLWAGLTWGALLVAAAAFAGGLGLAGWTHGLVDLSEPVLPLLEEHADVHPVRSALGNDDPALEVLLQAAGAAREGDDLALEAVAWRRVLGAAPDHEAAAARLTKVLALLGDARALPELR